MDTLKKFIKAYIKSMRLYYSFITGLTGWIGIEYYEYLAINNPGIPKPDSTKKIIILVILFLAWGVNQIFNDYLGLKEDRINAPRRPMVSGELNVKAALITSAVFMIIITCINLFYLNPFSFIFLFLGFLLNLVYEYSKRFGFLGNLVYALAISQTALFSFFAYSTVSVKIFSLDFVPILLIILFLHFIMCYFSYFKDYEGDKKAGVETIIVKYGCKIGSYIGFGLIFIPYILFFLFSVLNFYAGEINSNFLLVGFLTFFLHLWTGILYLRNSSGEQAFYNIKTSTRACTCGLAAIIALYNPSVAIFLYLITYIFVGFLFDSQISLKA